MLNTPFSPWPSFSEEEAEAVKRVLLSNKVNYWTGQECRCFEQEFAHFTGSKHAVAVANGTVALELALRALGIQQGDEVIVTPRTFLASATCIVNVGATPVFADVDLDSGNITASTIKAVLSPRTRAIVAVHLGGWPCEMDDIMALAEEHNLFVVEDCAQAHGATYKGRSVGSIGHVGCWSFCQDKIMTTGGEGGMVTTNDADLWSFMWSYKDHGKSWEAVYEREHPPGYRWQHESFGTNWRMTEMQAAIGRIQLKALSDWNRMRNEYSMKIWEAARSIPVLRAPIVPEYINHAACKCYIYLRPELLAAGWDKERIINTLNELGVPCYGGSCSEVYRERCFADAGLQPSRPLPNARQLGETSLMFLVHPTLTPEEIMKTCAALGSVMKSASR